jgi:hypothetical protein
MQCQRAPTASGLDDALAGAQRDLAADVVHLGDLRVFERRLGGGKVCAGVQHALVEPQAVELVAEVVVGVNVVARSGQRVRARALGAKERVLDQRMDCPAVGGVDDLQQVALDRDAAVRVALAERQLGMDEHAVQGAPVLEAQGADRLSLASVDGFAVGQHAAHRRAAGSAEEAAQQPAVDGQGPSRRCPQDACRTGDVRSFMRLDGRLRMHDSTSEARACGHHRIRFPNAPPLMTRQDGR